MWREGGREGKRKGEGVRKRGERGVCMYMCTCVGEGGRREGERGVTGVCMCVCVNICARACACMCVVCKCVCEYMCTW